MSRTLETVDASNWREFTAADRAVLVLSKSDCAKCAQWSAELTAYDDTDGELTGVRIGKLVLDQRGLIDFKKANAWIAEIDDLPFNVIYAGGEIFRKYAGGGIDRLLNRLRRLDE